MVSTFLGSVSAHFATARIAAFAPLSDGFWFLTGILLRLVGLLIWLAVWPAMVAPGQLVGGYRLDTLLTYTLVAAVFSAQLRVRTPIAASLRSGAIASRFTWPLPLATQYVAEMAGGWIVPLTVVSVPLVLVAPLLGVNPWPASVTAAGLFVVSLSLGVAIGIAIDFAYALFAVRLGLSGWSPLDALRETVVAFTSGAWVPLGVLPFHLGAGFQWLPFASAASAPLRIYTGTGDPLLLIPVQAIWAIVLALAVRALWTATRERLALHGG